MEPLSSFAISIVAGVVLEKYNAAIDKRLKKDLKDAYEKAVVLWSKNPTIRRYQKDRLRKELNKLFENPELLVDIKSNDSEISTFFDCYQEAIISYPKAHAFLIEMKDVERYKEMKEIAIETKVVVDETKEILTETHGIVKQLLEKSNSKKGKTSQEKQAVVSGELGVTSKMFKNYLDPLKNDGKYQEVIEFIIENFPSYRKWELLIELLRFCELNSSPNLGIKKFVEYRSLIGGSEHPEREDERQALNYYLGRLYTQQGEYHEAFYWHRENTGTKISKYYQLLSKFEVASLYYRVEDFDNALIEYERVKKALKKVDHSIHLEIHLYLYLATLYAINTIFNFSNTGNSTKIKDDSEQSIACTEHVKKLLPKLTYKDDWYDKVAWTEMTMAFGLESQGDFDKATQCYVEVENLIKNKKVTNSSSIHLMIYASRFYRRRRDYHKAMEKINAIKRYGLLIEGSKSEFSIYEETALILLNYGKKECARNFYKFAIRKFKKEKSIEMKMNWPIVKRVVTLCQSFGIKFDI